jgi:malate synthase
LATIVLEDKKMSKGLLVIAPVPKEYEEILSAEALDFVSFLLEKFSPKRKELLQFRIVTQEHIDSGTLPDFLSKTARVRNSEWQIAKVPQELTDRRVEITGPSGDPKMVINAFNSGANVFMADFEDAQSPSWKETIQGQINLKRALERTLTYTSPEGKRYALNEKIAVLLVRPRGWHLEEKHVLFNGEPISASIFDFALFLFHNWRRLSENGSGPYFYLPKIENHYEAQLWNDIFLASEQKLGLARGTIKATVLIETILAAFEMDEILYELREHSAGLNCGRWDYIFSFIKKFRNNPDLVLPDRSQVTMDKGFLAAYVSLLIRTCHKRGAHAIGGMSAFIPVKNDEEANRIAFQKVRLDKEREVRAGHDGTWVAHPGLVGIAQEIFDREMKGPNQISRIPPDVNISRENLLAVPEGTITEEGVRTNIRVGVQYLEAWLRGRGSVPLYHLMEDAATAEISRAQLWQWIQSSARMDDGGRVSEPYVRLLMGQELDKLKKSLGEEVFLAGQFLLASEIFGKLLTSEQFPEFLTTVAYEHLLALESNAPPPQRKAISSPALLNR